MCLGTCRIPQSLTLTTNPVGLQCFSRELSPLSESGALKGSLSLALKEWMKNDLKKECQKEYDWASAQCVLLKHWAGSDVSGRPGSPLHRISASFPCVFASAHLFHYFHLSFQDSLTSFLEARAPWLRSWIATKKEFWSALDPQCWWLYAAPLWHQAVLQAFSRMRVLPLTLYVYSLVSHQ